MYPTLSIDNFEASQRNLKWTSAQRSVKNSERMFRSLVADHFHPKRQKKTSKMSAYRKSPQVKCYPEHGVTTFQSLNLPPRKYSKRLSFQGPQGKQTPCFWECHHTHTDIQSHDLFLFRVSPLTHDSPVFVINELSC